MPTKPPSSNFLPVTEVGKKKNGKQLEVRHRPFSPDLFDQQPEWCLQKIRRPTTSWVIQKVSGFSQFSPEDKRGSWQHHSEFGSRCGCTMQTLANFFVLQTSNMHLGGFHSHGGTPSHHPFLGVGFSITINHPAFLGYPLDELESPILLSLMSQALGVFPWWEV